MCPWTQFFSMKFRLISILILRKFVKFDSLSDYQHFISKFWSDKTWLGDNTELLCFRNRLQPRRSRAPAAPALNCKVCFFGRVKKSHKSLGDNLCGLFVRAWGKIIAFRLIAQVQRLYNFKFPKSIKKTCEVFSWPFFIIDLVLWPKIERCIKLGL